MLIVESVSLSNARSVWPSSVSFEFFPPGDEAMAEQLWQVYCKDLRLCNPVLCRSLTAPTVRPVPEPTNACCGVLRETHLRVAPHLTCVGASRAEVLRIAQGYWDLGLRHLVALRGDPPAANLSDGRYRPQEDGFAYASDLVAGLAQVGHFEVSVAAYPEGHPESGGVDADLENLKRKIDAGANRAITQFFFETDVFLRYRDRCAAAGIRASIVPGILPVTRFPQMLRFAARCGASVPDWLHAPLRWTRR